MKPFRFHKLILLPALLVILPAGAGAGVLLTKTKQATAGSLVEGENVVSLQLPNGAVDYKKETLLWHTVDRDIDTFLKAAQKARAERNNPVALILFDLSAAQEPATQTQARSEAQSLRDALAEEAAKNVPAGGTTSEILTPEDKMARGHQMIDNGKSMLAMQQLGANSTSQATSTGQKNIAISQTKSPGEINIEEGNKLLAEGQKELEERKARETTAAVKPPEIKASLPQPPQARTATENPDNSGVWTDEEKWVNAGVGAIFALVVMVSLWQIVMKEPSK